MDGSETCHHNFLSATEGIALPFSYPQRNNLDCPLRILHVLGAFRVYGGISPDVPRTQTDAIFKIKHNFPILF